MGVGLEADEGAQGREDQGQRDHQRHQPGGKAELGDHHPVQRAGEQDRGHAHRNLEQGQAQKARKRKLRRRRVGEGEQGLAQLGPALRVVGAAFHHARTSSIA